MQAIPGSQQNQNQFWAFLAGFFVVWTIRATIVYSLIDTHIASPVAQQLYSNTIKAVVWVVPVIAYLWYIDHQPPARALLLTTPIARQRLLICGGIIVYLLGIVLINSLGGQHPSLVWHPMLGLKLVSTSVSSFLEEVLFRGFILAKLRTMLPFWYANGVTAVLFTLAHWPNWVWTSGWGYAFGHSGAILLLALALGWLVQLSRSLWPSITLHIANNILASLY